MHTGGTDLGEGHAHKRIATAYHGVHSQMKAKNRGRYALRKGVAELPSPCACRLAQHIQIAIHAQAGSSARVSRGATVTRADVMKEGTHFAKSSWESGSRRERAFALRPTRPTKDVGDLPVSGRHQRV
jgi:hypothetical protein